MFFRFCIFWHAVGAAATGPAQLHVGGGGAGGGGGRAHRREVLGVAQVEGSRRRRRRVQRRAQLGRALRLCDGAALSAGSGRTAPERPRGTLRRRGRRTRQNLCITRKRQFRAEDLYDFCHKSTDADRYGRESRVPSIWNYCTTVTDIDGYERAIESFSRVRRPTYKN